MTGERMTVLIEVQDPCLCLVGYVAYMLIPQECNSRILDFA
jgi:hypothetical protein